MSGVNVPRAIAQERFSGILNVFPDEMEEERAGGVW